jgi:hypothetical protein
VLLDQIYELDEQPPSNAVPGHGSIRSAKHAGRLPGATREISAESAQGCKPGPETYAAYLAF